ncbi:MAG: hypothetical protein HY079_01580 [Elusimicrobia bacterium]|nr:hypothetical protein [Elusimicrobiota bacterium]
MLTPEERERVRAAVSAAEKGLSAEIVPCLYRQSSPYPETVWAGAASGAAIACAAILLGDLRHPSWTPLPALMTAIAAAGIVGAAVGRWVRPVKRFFLGAQRMEDAVQRRAKEVFYDRGVAATAARDGVLVFASLLERRVVVLADDAVRARVKPEAWRSVVDALTAAAAAGRPADGLVAAVERTAAVLRAAGLTGKGGGQLADEPLEGGAE